MDGHGIHLSANSIGNESDALQDESIVHFWDEIFSHIEAVLGWFGLIACICWAERERAVAVSEPASGRIAALTAVLLGWTFFTSTVEGGTWPIELGSPRVALVSAILAYARSIGDTAPDITTALKDAERNTAPLAALRTTIDDANAIVGGLQRGRVRLGG